uniref:Uncharacterized protein n=1 Tax=Arundo donax TaxID=35708 RepID=A0A0A9A137_ARUDO
MSTQNARATHHAAPPPPPPRAATSSPSGSGSAPLEAAAPLSRELSASSIITRRRCSGRPAATSESLTNGKVTWCEDGWSSGSSALCTAARTAKVNTAAAKSANRRLPPVRTAARRSSAPPR